MDFLGVFWILFPNVIVSELSLIYNTKNLTTQLTKKLWTNKKRAVYKFPIIFKIPLVEVIHQLTDACRYFYAYFHRVTGWAKISYFCLQLLREVDYKGPRLINEKHAFEIGSKLFKFVQLFYV